MNDNEERDELDFESIQRMFAKRDAELARERKNAEEVPQYQGQLGYKKVDLRSEPKYETMHAKNIHITEKGRNHAKGGKLVLVAGVVIAIAIGAIAYSTSNAPSKPIDESGIIYVDENYGKTDSDVINPQAVDLSDFAVIVRRSTPNVGQIVDTTTRELTEMGVDNRSITDSDDLISTIDEIKAQTPEREIIVINVDGVANNGVKDTVVMTNYSNDAKSADMFAVAIDEANRDIYGMSSDVRCGKKTPHGERGMTSVEETLANAGYDAVACLTVAPSPSYISDAVNANNVATSIAESVIRVASLPKEDRYNDVIRRVQFGDTISQLAVDNDVSEEYIRSKNSDTIAENGGLLRYNTSLVVAPIPKNLTAKASVSNSSITTNPNDVTTTVSYYTVQENDTVTAIADELNLKIEDLVIPSGDIDRINVGDKIGYETTSGPVLVNKVDSKTK